MLKRRLKRLVPVYTYQNGKLLEMSCRGSIMIRCLMFDCPYFFEGDEAEHLGSGDNDDEPREQEPLREQVRIKG